MADIATFWDAANSRGDWAMPSAAFAFAADAQGNPIIGADGRAVAIGAAGSTPGAGLASGNDLETAVLISIFTDATADTASVLPDASGDPRGWWGDATIGSRLWLRFRAKQTPQTLLLIKADIEAALAWLINDGVAAAIAVSTEWLGRGILGCLVVVKHGDGTSVPLSFEWAWKEQ